MWPFMEEEIDAVPWKKKRKKWAEMLQGSRNTEEKKFWRQTSIIQRGI